MKTNLVPLSEALGRMVDGDLLAFESGGGIRAEAITVAGRGWACHVGTFVRWHGVPLCLHADEPMVAAVPLETLVAKRTIHVFRPNAGNRWPHYKVGRALRYGVQQLGRPYGEREIRRLALQFLPVLRWFPRFRPSTDDHADGRANPFCSSLRVAMDRKGGVDPVLFLADRDVTPSDLVQSPFYQYQFTLTLDAAPKPSVEPKVFRGTWELVEGAKPLYLGDAMLLPESKPAPPQKRPASKRNTQTGAKRQRRKSHAR